MNACMRALSTAALAASALASPGAFAVTTVYTQLSAFQAATLGWVTSVTDFDALAAGSAVAGGAGFTLAVDAGGLSPVVADTYWTSSTPNYLGLSGGDGQFIQGDLLTFTLGADARAFGVTIIGGADMLNFDDVGVRLAGAGFSVTTGNTALSQDGAGSHSFFLGVSSDAALGSLTLNGFSPGFMQYAVDDLRVSVVPELPVWLMFGGGLAALLRRRGARATKGDAR